MSQVVVFPRGQLSDMDREVMMGAGIIAVEADDPKAVVTILPGTAVVGADDLLMSAFSAIDSDGGTYVGKAFIEELYRRLKAREAAKEQPK